MPAVDEEPAKFKKPSLGFKSRKRKGQIRSTKVVENEEEEREAAEAEQTVKKDKFGMRELSKLEHIKSVHKRRKRTVGISGSGLSAEEQKAMAEEEEYKKQAWKKQGGLMSADRAMVFLDNEANVKMRHLNNTFAKESKRTDQERAMKDFIDREVARRKGYLEDYEKRKEEADIASLRALEDRKLYVLDDKYEAIPKTYAPQNQGEIGYAILEGIPEINLGTEHRIKNIEDTIKTRNKLATLPDEDIKRVTQVPSNFTANYLLHNRYEGEEFEASDTSRYIDVKMDLSQFAERKYDVCNDNSTR